MSRGIAVCDLKCVWAEDRESCLQGKSLYHWHLQELDQHGGYARYQRGTLTRAVTGRESFASYISFGGDVELVASVSESVTGVQLNGVVPARKLGGVTHGQEHRQVRLYRAMSCPPWV